MTGINCREQRHPPKPATLLLRLKPGGPVVQRQGYVGVSSPTYGTAPSDTQTAFTDIAGDFPCQGCQAFNNTNINNAAFGVNGLGNRVLYQRP
ncbi:hypothetical protein SAMN05444169_7792 [Bradyrhizobium erythrophlei]|uniref:Uncharacterized protein n=1 Tax=Bradyrhizobium erythrophlei TaxID=1437360 RepID=A0A1M5THT6_9BRAD|nr:hypothetical protein SAMN05444169_7792 [Bradyrhizobium erythrophlei]